jgi:hypothetical protein
MQLSVRVSHPIRTLLSIFTLVSGAAHAATIFSVVAKSSDTFGGKTLTGFGCPAINRNGVVAFPATFAGGSGIFTSSGSSIQTGDSIAGNVLLDPFGNGSGAGFNAAGTMIFVSAFTGGVGMFTQSALLAKEGDTVGGKVLTQFGQYPAINDSGVTAYFANFQGGGGIYPSGPKTGDTVAGQLLSGLTFSDPALSNDGTIAFIASFSGGGVGVFKLPPHQPAVLVAQVGDTVAGHQLTAVGPPYWPAINSSDTVYFEGRFAQGSSFENAIFTPSSLLFQTGAAFGSNTITQFAGNRMAVNDGGAIVFLAEFQSSSGGQLGLFSLLGPVALPGDAVGNKVLSSPGCPAMNNDGQIAFQATFSDSTSGIVLASPVPVTAPFGSIDTPAENAMGLAGAIAVTGWAAGNPGIATVDIWREPVAGETPSSNGLLFVESASIVPGSRPDVAAAFPGYPNNDSGWGALVLSNELPNSNGPGLGNGTYRIHVLATGASGQTTDLGTRTFTTDNAHSNLPFGTIDTPAEGGTVSGSAYVNFGWVVTPLPATIPKDGSTINVFIDNLPMGHPVYNNYRADIATLFPGLNNSGTAGQPANGGAIGYLRIDTTKLSNGLHSISWGVADNQGHRAGIGSRFFIVQN